MMAPVKWACCAAVLGYLGTAVFEGSCARGSTLDLTSQNPDLFAGTLTASYSPSSGNVGTLTVNGWPTSFNITGSTASNAMVVDGQYDLTAQINNQTGQLISGSLNIAGTIPSLASSGTLLTGQPSQFGFMPPPGGDIFEFLVSVTGGDLASYFHGQIGIELTAFNSGFNGSFTSNFSTPVCQAVSDTFFQPVPEPATGVLLLTVFGFVLPALIHRR
jgi:hypothetical protein